jgi:predicted ATPase
MLDRLSQSGALQVLGHGFHDAERRQQTLRETIAWSDALLSAEERSLFHALGIFTSGTTLEGAAAVAGLTQDTALELLASLADKSILQRAQNPSIEDRFVMLQTLREYALSELQAVGALPDLRRRHATHCLTVAERASAALPGPDQGRLLAELETDHEEMRTGLQWLSARAVRRALAIRGAGRVLGWGLGRRASPPGSTLRKPSLAPCWSGNCAPWLRF